MTKVEKKNRNEILWNIINSLLAGSLVFLGALTTGTITKVSIFAALVAAGIVACTKFKDYWAGEKKEYSSKIFKFL